MAYATVGDVQDRLGKPLEGELETLVATRLDDAERLIKKRIPDLDDQIVDGVLDEQDVVYVEAEAVLRLARNPEGYQQETDGNYSYMLFHEISSGRLTITPDEWGMLGIRRKGFRVLVPTLEVPT